MKNLPTQFIHLISNLKHFLSHMKWLKHVYQKNFHMGHDQTLLDNLVKNV